MLKRLARVGFLSILLIITSSFTPGESKQEEGMFPLEQLSALNLNALGLKIPQSEIYNPGSVSLTNSLVRLGGCTGSFISDQGLIITNHHCVFSAVASSSSAENNYLEDGFYASSFEKELKTEIPCRITESFEDVSTQVLKGVDELSEAQDKKKRIQENIAELQKTESAAHPDREIQISEMYVGKFYTLFRYKLLEDVRLVYVPPQAIGKFGGESDNWMWPRHNGDFSIVRVYENGKPYKPQRHLEVYPNGTKADDFVFIMGYPGRTYRHMPAEYLTYQKDYVLPLISEWFDKRIDILEADAAGSEELMLRYACRIASLSNTAKNFKGKLQGFQRTSILQDRYKEQRALEAMVKSDPASNSADKLLFSKLNDFHERKFDLSNDVIMVNQIIGASGVFFGAQFIAKYQAILKGKSKAERQAWIVENHANLSKELKSGYQITNESVDLKNFAGGLSLLASKNSEIANKLLASIGCTDAKSNGIESALKKTWHQSKLLDSKGMTAVFDEDPLKFLKHSDKIVKWAAQLNRDFSPAMDEWQKVNAEIDAILPHLADLKEHYTAKGFIPDANATLRFTYGHVRGYEPTDGIYNDPYTTIDGILEKAQDKGDYYMPAYLIEKYKTVEPADVLRHPEKKKVVVGMLYNLDTTGGNSGSPILDAYGRLVGVNFDRAFSATINDYAWNESYSRSIGVDIRYVLYVMKYMHQADEILSEMGVDL
jgi:predicted  nucleic acid-binding Zn-ribbon protein